MNSTKKISLRFTLIFIYAIIGVLWILLSDTALLYFVKDAQDITAYQSYKGWAFILITTILLYLLLLGYDKIISLTKTAQDQTEKKFRLLYEDAPNPYQALDKEGNILDVNQKWLDTLGYKKEEVIGHWFGDLLNPRNRDYFENNFAQFKSDGSIDGIEFEMQNKNGKTIPILLHGQIIYDNKHQMLHTNCSFENISDKRKLEHLNKVSKLIRDINQSIVRVKDKDTLLQESCNILLSSDLYNYAWIKMTQNHPSKLYYASKRKEQFAFFQDKLDKNWKPTCIELINKQKHSYIYIEDTNDSCKDCPLKSKELLKENSYSLELLHNNSHYGYLTVSSSNQFERDELELLQEVAGDIAYGLFNIETEQILKENEERYRFAVDGSTDGLWDWDLVNNTMYYSPRWKEILGYIGNQLPTSLESWESHLHPDDKEKTFLAIKNSHEGKTTRYYNIHRLRHKDGHWVWIESRGQTLFDESGKAIRMIGSHTDISELKKAEKKLQISNEKFEKAFNNSPNMIIITRIKTGEIVDINHTFETILEHKREDTIGKTVFDIGLWYDLKDRDRYIETFHKYHHVKDAKYIFNSKSKKAITSNVNASVVTIDNEEYILAVAEDITEKNRLYKLLQKSQRQAKLGSWEHTASDDKLFWSDEVYNIFELDNSKAISYEEFLNVIHPDDRIKVSTAFESSIQEHKNYYAEHRLLFNDGRIKYLVERAEHFYDKENKYIRCAGTIQDITEKTVLEQEVAKGNETLHKLADNIPGAIYQYKLDTNGKASFPYANKGTQNIYEVSPLDVQKDAQLVFDILHPDDFEMILQTIQDSAQTLKEWNLDYRVQLPKKGERWLRGKAKPEKLEDGSILWNGFITDITDEVQIEKEIKKRDALLTSVFQVIPDFLFIMDDDGVIIDFRAQKKDDLYIQPELFLGKPTQEMLPQEVGELFTQHIENLSEKFELNIFRYQLEIKGQVHHYEARMARLPMDKKIMTIIRDISEQVSYEQTLVFQSQMLEQSLAATAVVDENLKYSYVNNAYMNMWGYDTKEEILDVSPHLHCCDPKMGQYIVEKVEEMGTYSFLFKAQKKDGTCFDALMAVQYFHHMGKKHYLSSTMDVTEQQKSLHQLKQKKQELETIILDAPNPMILHNEDDKILMINQAWLNASGYLKEELSSMSTWIEDIYDDKETQVSMKKHLASLYQITEKLDEGNFTFLNKKREKITWQFSSAPLGVIDGKRTVLSTAMDITELKHKDEMLISQSRHAAMGEMIGMIAHQWRQPLSTISMDANNMLLDIAIDNFSPSEAEKYANSISAQTQHLSQTIDDFRNFFKPDKEMAQVNIEHILDQTLSIVKDSLKNNNITFTSSFETHTEVNAYPRELMQVFVNIITNAKDALAYTKQENAFITIRVYEDEKYVNTEICDNGGGIADDILPKVFDPYFSTKDEKTGTGLGLYMSKMIIEDHLHGLIKAYTNDIGACFNVRLLKEKAERK